MSQYYMAMSEETTAAPIVRVCAYFSIIAANSLTKSYFVIHVK